jgi:2-polyprenyl-6-methoxyphenol hydroxylase-like FAD-dependent oxidoreductase
VERATGPRPGGQAVDVRGPALEVAGDAGYCGSPASGQGTSMALVGAYVLAGELRAADGDHEAAFAAYEHELRDYAAADPRLAYTQRPPKEACDATDTGVAVPGAADADEVIGSLRLKDY